MPVVAIVAGIASAAGGVAAFAAATTTLGSIAAGLAVVGGISTALGAATGNKKLMKFGMVVGIAGAAAGGLSSLAGAGAESAAGAAASGATESIMGAAQTAPSYADWAARGAAEPGMLSMSGLDSAVGDLTGASFAGAPGAAAPWAATPASQAAATAASGATRAADFAPMDRGAIASAQNSFAPSTGDAMGDAVRDLRIGDTTLGSIGDAGASAFSGFGKFMGANPEIAKLGAGMLSGVGQGYMAQQQQKDAERMAAEQRARINTSITGQRQRY